jgi:membrane-associated protease RseP (regulator of RpoE activity)
MSQIITAQLSRTDGQPWGFRLQGGKDFGTPLVIQKVNTGSIADKAGLKAGDGLVRINQTDLFNLRHKEAQDSIVKAGASFELVVQRGGATWKPSVTPINSSAPSPVPGNFTPVTKTSLAANKPQVSNIGSGHNSAAKPFNSPNVRSITTKQYNSPVAMYSDETIAESLSSQAEVLAGGCLGVNFKKNEKVYNPEKSEVLKALQESDHEPESGHRDFNGSTYFWRQSHAIGGSATSNATLHQRPLTPNYQNMGTFDERKGVPLQQNSLAPSAPHRPSLPVSQAQPAKPVAPVVKPTPVQSVPPKAPSQAE